MYSKIWRNMKIKVKLFNTTYCETKIMQNITDISFTNKYIFAYKLSVFAS